MQSWGGQHRAKGKGIECEIGLQFWEISIVAFSWLFCTSQDRGGGGRLAMLKDAKAVGI